MIDCRNTSVDRIVRQFGKWEFTPIGCPDAHTIKKPEGRSVLRPVPYPDTYLIAAPLNPLNFLNLRIPEYEAVNSPLHLAERELRAQINLLLYPNPKSGGRGGGYGGWSPDPLRDCNINLSGHNLSIRDVLTGIALACGKALWIVELSRDELSGQTPKWEGIPRNKQGQSPLANRWKFVPLNN